MWWAMSSGQKQRTPQYFPRMKVRGRRRRFLAPYQRMAGAFTSLGEVTRDALEYAREWWSKELS